MGGHLGPASPMDTVGNHFDEVGTGSQVAFSYVCRPAREGRPVGHGRIGSHVVYSFCSMGPLCRFIPSLFGTFLEWLAGTATSNGIL
jgi:hypothetical protein